MTDPTEPSITAVFRAYRLAQQSRNLTHSYINLQSLTLDYFTQRVGDKAMSAVTADDCRTFLLWLAGHEEQPPTPLPTSGKGKPLSGASVDIHFRNLKAFMRWAEDEELIARSPMRKVKRPVYEEKETEALSEVELVRLLDCVKGDGDRNALRDYTVILFIALTGTRLAEVADLCLDRINLEEGYARVLGKGRVWRDVPLELELRRALQLYIVKHRRPVAGETALFLNEYGTKFGRQGIRTMVVRALRRYVPRPVTKYGPHLLRHTWFTLHLRATKDLKRTSKIGGHKQTRTTDERYTHLALSDVLRTAEENPVSTWLDRVARGGN